MLTIRPMQESDAVQLVAWNDWESEEFLTLWSGRCYTYPLTEKKLNAYKPRG